jgi:hypothetical protein
MCFGGGGKSAEKMYQEMKPEFGPLPSLSMKRIERKEQTFKDVPSRVGMQKRSLLMPMERMN